MKKLSVKKGSECMACLACAQACSEAFYKVMDPGRSCIQIVERMVRRSRPSVHSAENVRRPVRQVRSSRTQRVSM